MLSRRPVRCSVAFVAIALVSLSLVAVGADKKPAPPPTGVVVLDDSDPTYEGKESYEDNLSLLDGAAKVQARLSGLNVCETIGSPHRIAVDVARKRIWLAETVGRRLLQYDLKGKELLAIPDRQASALAVNPTNGHVWVCRSKGTIKDGSTDVLDQDGRRLATHDFRGFDIAYDGKSKAFWLVAQQLLKVSPEGVVLIRKDITNWCAVSVAVNQKTGTVWVVTRRHSGDLGKNELLGFNTIGDLLYKIPLADHMPFRVAVDHDTGTVWVTSFRKSVLRYSEKGEPEGTLEFAALTADVDRSNGNVWIVTAEDILNVDRKGKVVAKTAHKAKTTQAWISSY
jgi:DNA-binding beta-propeller fold protein YncE